MWTPPADFSWYGHFADATTEASPSDPRGVLRVIHAPHRNAARAEEATAECRHPTDLAVETKGERLRDCPAQGRAGILTAPATESPRPVVASAVNGATITSTASITHLHRPLSSAGQLVERPTAPWHDTDRPPPVAQYGARRCANGPRERGGTRLGPYAPLTSSMPSA